MTNTKTIQYTTHKGGNAEYAGITKSETDFVLEVLQQGLYALLERSNHDLNVQGDIHRQDNIFRKQTEVNNRTNNSMSSFLAGVLTQHLNANKLGKKKDFSTKQLPGITFSTKCFNHIDNNFPIIEFEDVKKSTRVNAKSKKSTVGRLFEYN